MTTRHQFGLRIANPVRRKIDIEEAFSAVSPKVRHAAEAAAQVLQEKGVRFLLVGGLGVGANGVPRATKDVDFLVGDEAFDRKGIILSYKPGMPLEADGIAIDLIPIPMDMPKLDELLTKFQTSEGIPVAPAEVIILMKLTSNRLRDRDDINRMLRAGVDFDSARDVVRVYGSEELLAKLEDRIIEAQGEEEP